MFPKMLRRRRKASDFRAEIEAHLQLETERLREQGLSEEAARQIAYRAFGNVTKAQERFYESDHWLWLDHLWQDLRFALRMLRKSPGFTAVAVLTLALGIGANTAVFSMVYSDLLRPLPYPRGNRLVLFGMMLPSFDSRPFLFTSSYLQLASGKSPFESTASWRPGIQGCDLTEVHPVRLPCVRVGSTFLPTFGVTPILGRNFTAEEDGPDAPNVCLISYGLWQNRWGGRRTVLDKTLSLDGVPTRIMGILPRNFEWPTLAHVDVILPEALSAADRTDPNRGVVRAYARLKPSVTLAAARAQLAPVLESWRRASPPMFRKEMRLGLISVREDQIGSLRLALLVLFGASLALLLLTVANVANLLWARGAARERELAIRAALGATRKKLLSLQLMESSLLGLAGGFAGTAGAFALLKLFVGLAPAGIPRMEEAGLGLPVLLFVLGASLLSGLLCGLGPALAAKPVRTLLPGPALGKPRRHLRTWLVAAQVALSFVLVIAAGLFLDTLRNIDKEPIGMETGHVLTAEIERASSRGAAQSAGDDFFERLEDRLRNLPGVTGLAVSDSLPPTGGERAHRFFDMRVEGQPPFPKGTGGIVGWRIITPGYFRMLGIALLEGRGFRAGDQEPHADAIILNKKLAARLFPDGKALRKHLQLSPPSGPWFTVVGVVGDVKHLLPSGRIEASAPEYYVPHKTIAGPRPAGEAWDRRAFFLVKSPLKSTAVAPMVRGEIASLDPTLPVQISTLDSRVEQLRVRPRFNAALITLFALLGLFLAALGLYGIISFQVSTMGKDIGVRIALGAMPRHVIGLVAWSGVRSVLTGLALGAALSFAVTRFLHGLLYGVNPSNPLIGVVSALLLLLVALAACYLPARRAMKVDPITALRHE